MLKIDNSLLVEIGLDSLPEAEKNSFLKHVYETLEMRVGIRLADQMTNEQLDEFEQYFEAKDDAGAFKWLETNFPNYKDIVQEEFDKLKSEVAQAAPQILATSQATQQIQQSPPPSASNSASPPPPPPPPAAYDASAYSTTPTSAELPPAPPSPAYQAPPPSAVSIPPPPVPAPAAYTQQPYDNYYNPEAAYQQPPYPDQQPPAGPPPQPSV